MSIVTLEQPKESTSEFADANAAQRVLDRITEMQEQYHGGLAGDVSADELAQWQPKRFKVWQVSSAAVRQAAGLQNHQTLVDDHKIHWLESGSRHLPTVVLLHGFGSCKENWGFVARELKGQCHLLAPDIFGFGESDFRHTEEYRLNLQASRLWMWLDKIGVENAVIVGNSMGGGIAACMAASQPERVSALCLMNSAGAPGRRMSMLELGMLAGKNLLIPNNMRETRRLFSTTMHRRQWWLGGAFSFLLSDVMSHRGPVNQCLFGQLVDSLADVYRNLPKITAKTLVMWGSDDQILDLSCVEEFEKQMPDCHSVVLPAVGHLPMLEQPRTVAQILSALANPSI